MATEAAQLCGMATEVAQLRPARAGSTLAFNDPMLQDVGDDELAEPIDMFVPLGREGSADAVAAVVALPASDDASLVTGRALVADGGLTAV
jgi:NAD(P)-dependent dehydrogenase (short-subunit alcohol dehydrogenase family)